MRKIIFIAAFVTSSSLFAQNRIADVLSSVEENNTTLKTLREDVKAQQLGNKTGIVLSNPEVEFGRLWGTPRGIKENEVGISVTQSFDFVTISGMKRRLADKKNDLVEFQYKSERINVLIQAKQYCIDLVYYNSLKAELAIRLEHANIVATASKKSLEQGESNKLEHNKVQLNLSNVEGEMSRVDIECRALLSELKRLNGGVDVNFEGLMYGTEALPMNFDDWFASAENKNPVLQYVKEQVDVSRDEVKLNKRMNIPAFSVGYVREQGKNESLQGLKVGITVPLWENKNKVKQARATVTAAIAKEHETKQQFYDQLQTLYLRASGLQQTSIRYSESLVGLNSTELLIKALDAGEISLLDYILEIGLYYSTVNQALEAERDYQKAFADLSAVEL